MSSSGGDSCESDCEEFEIKLESQVFTKLTEKVRMQYLKFLERQLEENVRTYQEQCDEEAIQREKNEITKSVLDCAKILEDLAVKEATLTQLYQRVMVKTIADVKESTRNNKLVENLKQIFKNNEQTRTHSIATQTIEYYYETKAIQTEEWENVPKLSLDERIDLLQANLPQNPNDKLPNLSYMEVERNSERQISKRKRLNYHQRHKKQKFPSKPTSPATAAIWHSPTPPPSVGGKSKQVVVKKVAPDVELQLEDDEIAQELEKLFTEQETDLEEVFGISLRSSQSNCDTSMEIQSNDDSKIVPNKESAKPIENLIVKKPATSSNSNEQQFPPPVKDLRYSLWPCECFMQKRRLSIMLNRMIEEDIRWHDILKWQFNVLFGDEDDDDFAMCSPSIELDEVLISSCMRRISPWIVKNLMKPLNDGLIANRFLFKKLAKKLAHHIIMENQYPDENVIRTVIENFFCIHRAVMDAADLDDIRMIPIDNHDEQL